MSKIGRQPIKIPENVEVKISGNSVWVKGPKGELKKEFLPEVKIEIRDGQVIVSPQKKTKRTAALWGLSRALINNMILGVKEGFSKKIEIEGIGFKAALQGQDLVLNLGFSHPIKFAAVPGIELKTEKNSILISGIDKGLVGQISANLRALKEPEPYKGKGLRYAGEVIKLKAGKKAVKEGF